MSDLRFEINPDIRQASTPPSRVYTDPSIYAAARERIFARSWQLVADTSQVRVPGQVHPFTLLEGCLDEQLLLTRDDRDGLHCLSNVCTHRGNLVCEHGGVESGLRCRYHGRRFGLDGAFVSMPEFDGVVNFPSEVDNLSRLPLERWGPFVFTGIKPWIAFADWIGPMRKRLEWFPVEQCKLDATRCRDYLVQANWALYCENYLEGFHIPFVHSGLSDTLDYGSYRTELFDHSSVQIGISRGGDALRPPPGSPDHGQAIGGYYFWLFPNTIFNFYPWGISVNIVKPLGVDRTRVSFLSYVCDSSKLERGAGAELDRVEREDEAIVEAVQKGLRSRLYDRGRYSPARETGTHHFHRLLAEALGT